MTRQLSLSLLLMFALSGTALAAASQAEVTRLIEAGQYQQALSRLDSLPGEEKRSPYYLFNRARALAGAGQLAQAIAQYLALIKAKPSLPEPYNNLAAIYIQQGKVEEAQALLNKAMQTHPSYARIYKNLATVNAARARDAYAKALQMPSAAQAAGLVLADKLSLPEEPTPVIHQSVPIATAAVKPTPKPAMVYQAPNKSADNKQVAVEKSPAPVGVDSASVQTVLQAWASAWSTKNVDQYLRFYSDDYAVDGMSHAAWMAQRRERILRPKWIRVSLRNLVVTTTGAEAVRVRLEQEYAADNYRDVTRKEFVLQKQGSEWRITQERGLGYIVR